ncbi:N-acetylglucosamine kinase [Marinobacterium nitratireducens]|uniref:N-acetylglucosamine kinase n=1 Tax=Marinobacterium nitratireducens TaxID=518897 RepID=A0A917Z6S3_9GAMM|nr:BadF/BadG/BcrA/BcrD ATPase family protein [Marinobacterium nitratireducens]GGO76841.1 N-acetylglucosamine kinase [Marinobacterium nitratireducens]
MGNRDFYLLGVDGGGTSCRARLTDLDGRVLGEGQAGSANVRLGVDRAYASILQACGQALGAAGLDRSVLARIYAGFGLAGAVDEARKSQVLAFPNPFAGVVLETDAHAACLGAHAGADGGILILGTGSCALGYRDGGFLSVGGWGFMISDQGSGAWLGLNAVRQSLLAHEGVIAAGSLSRALMARFDDSPLALLNWSEQAQPGDYGAFAPLVLEQANAGDEMALGLVRQSAGEAGALVERLLALGMERICLMGGLAAAIEPWLSPAQRAHLVDAAGDAMDGALLLARRGFETGRQK